MKTSKVVFFATLMSAAATFAFAAPMEKTDLSVGPHTDQDEMTISMHKPAHDLLPDRIKNAGRIIVGIESNAGYPNSVTVNGNNYGLTLDLGRALAATLGLDIAEVPMPFSNIIPSLGSGRIDMTSALVLDRPDRREVVDYVDTSYSLAFAFVLNADSDMEEINYQTSCGESIGANTGSSQATRLKDESERCEADGKPAIDLHLFPSNAETMLAVQSGRVEAGLLSAAMVKYMLRGDPPGIRAGSKALSEKSGLVGIAFPKGSDLVPAFREAMLELHRNGAWEKILGEYNYAESFPTEAVIMNTDVVQPGKLPASLLP